MKAALSLLVTLISLNAFADSSRCASDPDLIASQVAASSSCESAAQLAHQCAYGSSADSLIAGAAISRCEQDLQSSPDADKALLAKLRERCDSAWANKSGTMYISYNQFCKLDATVWIHGLIDSEE